MGTLKTVSWNIQGGGLDNGDPARLVDQMTLVATLEPDIVCLQECKWGDDDKTVLRLVEATLMMDGHMAVSPRYGCNLVVLISPRSGLEVVKVRKQVMWPRWHGQLRVECKGVTIASAHASPVDPISRLQEAYMNLDLGGKPFILAGDFNDDPWGEDTDRSHQPGYKKARHSLPGPVYNADHGAAAVMHQAGYVDVAAELAGRLDDPAYLAPTAGYAEPEASRAERRCDRVYVDDADDIIEYFAAEEPDLSDHAYVCVTTRVRGIRQ